MLDNNPKLRENPKKEGGGLKMSWKGDIDSVGAYADLKWFPGDPEKRRHLITLVTEAASTLAKDGKLSLVGLDVGKLADTVDVEFPDSYSR